ncbi:Zinc finger protein ZFP69, partial [Merops nubicus]
CDNCSKGFSHSSTFTHHHPAHTRNKPYVCDNCSKSFTKKSTLTQNMRTHNGEKP